MAAPAYGPALGWLDSPTHRLWLFGEESRLLGFARGWNDRVDEHGHGVLLDHAGRAVGGCAPTFHSARMAHSYALAALRGHPGARPVTSALLAGLAAAPGAGWADAPPAGGADAGAAPDALQSLYALDHVLLAAASGVALGDPVAPALLDRALTRLDEVFWEPATGRGIDRVDADGRATDYRGMNSNMHLVEALLAVSDATGDPEWRERALGISRFVVAEAPTRDGRILEHYDGSWRPLPEHNRASPDHPFVPYGSTIGHGFEWARLIAGLAARVDDADLLAGAVLLYERAASDGWSEGSAEGGGQNGRGEGFVYTVDWNGQPVSRQRLWWVAAEAIAAASVHARIEGGATDARRQYEWWLDHIATHFIDLEGGSWRQRLEPTDAEETAARAARAAEGTDEPGKSDLYHALQSVLIPRLPVATSVIAAIAAEAARA